MLCILHEAVVKQLGLLHHVREKHVLANHLLLLVLFLFGRESALAWTLDLAGTEVGADRVGTGTIDTCYVTVFLSKLCLKARFLVVVAGEGKGVPSE